MELLQLRAQRQPEPVSGDRLRACALRSALHGTLERGVQHLLCKQFSTRPESQLSLPQVEQVSLRSCLDFTEVKDCTVLQEVQLAKDSLARCFCLCVDGQGEWRFCKLGFFARLIRKSNRQAVTHLSIFRAGISH